uniref:Type I polyketide synthase n=1 Tax=Gambierdiscus excentricus TaxID=986170 RepID=A0A1S6K7Z0_9DINO|nr:type I polyketide synthase [Gambierdiscus excentricus]
MHSGLPPPRVGSPHAMASAGFALGSLVEFSGLPEVLELGAGELVGTSDGTKLKPYRPNGKRGKVVDYDSDRYTVETFDAVVLSVTGSQLKEYVPDQAVEGGFHLAWPAEHEVAEAAFCASAMGQLMEDGYCVVQTSMSDETREKAMEEAARMKCKRMRQEFETAYLGRQFKCKTAWMDNLVEAKEEVLSSLDYCDFHLSSFTKFLLPLAPCALDFVPYSRTNGMVRMPYQSSEEGQQAAEEVNEDDIDDGLVDSHIQFIKRRKVCLLYVIATGGGEMTLINKDESKENVVLEIAKGRLIVFLTSKLTYIYNPFDPADLVLQSWVLTEPEQLKFVSLQGDQESKDEAMGITVGPNTPMGRRINVFGMGLSLPGGALQTDLAYWAAVAVGTDGQTKTPYTRFDMDLYCRAVDEWFPGTSYAYHGGYVNEDIYAMDNELFGVSEEEAVIMAPAQRCLLEKGYEALYKTGFRQGPDLKGRKVGVFLGHSGDDWSFTQQFTLGWEDRYKMGHQSRIWGCIAGRMAYVLGLKGPQALTDTACSSALVAYGVGHTMLRSSEVEQPGCSIDNKLTEALMCGVNLMPGPGNYINLCGPHMLSAVGRCFTFDASADGFARGEGYGAFFVKSEEIMSEASFATVIGACLNQDGRSASMTAPNGPSQQDCIRGSMMEAGLTANQVTCAECHGTGTALGDPIEVGALRGVMQDRIVPIIQCSAKAHIGHLEASAGTAGLIKCMMMCAACVGSPNCHLSCLNPHLDVAGYPTIFADELTDYGYNAGYSGVSSFGFGGANSRADVFASAKKGPHTTGTLDWGKVDYVTIKCPFDQGPMHFSDGKCVPRATSKTYKHQVYHADAIRDEFDAYDYNSSLFSGEYQLAPRDAGEMDDPPKDPIFIVGSWDKFQEAREMDIGDEDNAWTFQVAIGESRCERFQMRINNQNFQALYPCVPNGNLRARCIGPDDQGEGLYWVIDGRDSNTPAGSAYQITLTWGNPPKVRWELLEDSPSPDWCKSMRHAYYVIGSWTGGIFDTMRNVSSSEAPNTWEARVRIGMTGMEWFRFGRDADFDQQIYPAKTGCSEETLVCGPDDMCGDKSWRLGGKTGEVVTLRLQVVDAHIVVTVLSNSMGTRVMQSVEGAKRHSYYISGSFNNWSFSEMVYDEETTSTFRFKGVMSEMCQEYFYIAAEADQSLAFFPEANGSYPGDSIVAGPDAAEETRVFFLFSLKAGAEFEISFDRSAFDRRKVVSVKWFDRVDADSMKLAYYNYHNMGAPSGELSDRQVALPDLL